MPAETRYQNIMGYMRPAPEEFANDPKKARIARAARAVADRMDANDALDTPGAQAANARRAAQHQHFMDALYDKKVPEVHGLSLTFKRDTRRGELLKRDPAREVHEMERHVPPRPDVPPEKMPGRIVPRDPYKRVEFSRVDIPKLPQRSSFMDSLMGREVASHEAHHKALADLSGKQTERIKRLTRIADMSVGTVDNSHAMEKGRAYHLAERRAGYLGTKSEMDNIARQGSLTRRLEERNNRAALALEHAHDTLGEIHGQIKIAPISAVKRRMWMNRGLVGAAGAGLLAAGAYGLKKYREHNQNKESSIESPLLDGFIDGMKEAAGLMVSEVPNLSKIAPHEALSGHTFHRWLIGADGLPGRYSEGAHWEGAS